MPPRDVILLHPKLKVTNCGADCIESQRRSGPPVPWAQNAPVQITSTD